MRSNFHADYDYDNLSYRLRNSVSNRVVTLLSLGEDQQVESIWISRDKEGFIARTKNSLMYRANVYNVTS